MLTEGNDGNDGLSQATAFATILQGTSAAQPGDTIKILPGTYQGDDPNDLWNEVFLYKSGSPGNYITYQGVADAQGNLPKIVSGSVAAISVYNASYVIIENLEFLPNEEDVKDLINSPNEAFNLDPDPDSEPFGPQAWIERKAFNIAGGSHHVIIRNTYIHDFPGNGIGVGDADVVLIEDNLVEHCAYENDKGNSGISLYHVVRLDVPGFAEYPDHRIIIRDNVSRYNTNLQGFVWSNPVSVTDGNGIIIDDFNQVHNLGHNANHPPAEHVPYVPYTGRTLVLENVCYGNGGYGINIFSSDYVDVYNNTAYDNGQSARIENPAWPVLVQNAQLQVGGSDYYVVSEMKTYVIPINDVKITNNIFVNAAAEALPATRFYLGNNIDFTNNIFWNTAGPQEGVANSDIVTDPEFVNAVPLTPQQTNLLATMTNPFDPSSTSAQVRTPTKNHGFPVPDLRLRAGSPAIDAGVAVDFGTPQGQAIDIGALEHGAAGEPEPPTDPQPPTGPGNVVLRAYGLSGSEQVEIRYNDQRVGGLITLSTDFEEYQVQVDNPTGNFKVAFINDASDRDAVVDWLKVDGVQQEAEAQEINTAAWLNGSCGAGSRTQVMNCNGYIDFGRFGSGDSEPPVVGGEGSISIRAKGSLGDERMSLLVDGQVVDSWTVARTTSGPGLTNGSFEQGTKGWDVTDYTTPAVVSSPVRSGSSALRLSARTRYWAGVRQDITELVKQHGEGTYTLEAWMRTVSGSTTALLRANINDTQFTQKANVALTSSEWTKVSATVAISTTALNKVILEVMNAPGAPLADLLIDDVRVVAPGGKVASSDDYLYSGYRGGEIEVRFDNDGLDAAGGDRNLLVDYVEVCGVRLQAEGAERSVDCGRTREGFVMMWCNSSLRFGDPGCATPASASSSIVLPETSQTLHPEATAKVEVYPNPATQQVMITGPDHYNLTIYDLQGGRVQQQLGLSGQSSLDISHLRPGVYLLRTVDTQTQQTHQQRLIVE